MDFFQDLILLIFIISTITFFIVSIYLLKQIKNNQEILIEQNKK